MQAISKTHDIAITSAMFATDIITSLPLTLMTYRLVMTQLTMLRWANVGSGRIGRGRKANVEPTLDQRLQFTSGNG